MNGAYGPLRRQLMAARGGGGAAIYPEDMGDDDMVYPGGGDLGMEMSEPYERNLPQMQPQMGPARAMPVHSTPEMESEYRRMGMRPPQGMRDMTRGLEAQRPGPIREQLHAAQHQMMLNDQNTVNQTKRMELAAKKSMVQQRILALQRAGRMQDAAKLQSQFDMLMNDLDKGFEGVPAQ